MSFIWPGLLSLLLAVPALVAVYLWVLRLQMAAALRFACLGLVR